MPESSMPPDAPLRGRPKTRFADRNEQVRQNMKIYRARRTAELEALARTLEVLLTAFEDGESDKCFRAAAAVAGVWKESVLRGNLNVHGKPARRVNGRAAPSSGDR